ncbi:MAG: hypothetical protein Q4F57_02395 [Weeksellaceae bacterium]|nr:hypothetical protein [Weeksellaceae bacterium]
MKSIFTDNQIFHNRAVNDTCDKLYNHCIEHFGYFPLSICGSVSRALQGEDVVPKDLDFLTDSEFTFSTLQLFVEEWFPNHEITHSPSRIIIHLPVAVIEIWDGKDKHYTSQHHHCGIPYVVSKRTKKV